MKNVKASCDCKGKQRGIVPFHVKGKAELWYRLKDLLRTRTERETNAVLEKQISQKAKQIISIYVSVKLSWAGSKWWLSGGYTA